MERVVSELYRRKFARKVGQYNHPRPAPGYLVPLVGDKKYVRVAELGAGPVSTLGDVLEGVCVDVWPSDVLGDEYAQMWEELGVEPLVPVTTEDMENLSYLDDFFDVVHCRNALDHTPDAYRAIGEMQRVCKPGGYVYLAHAPSQKRKFGGHHCHNFEEFELPGFDVREEDGLIVAVWQKPN